MEELSLLARLLPQLRSGPGVALGPGDDCAAIDCGGPELVLAAVDHLVDGKHYLSGTTPPEAAGAKLFNRNASDIAAMGGSPRWALLALAAGDRNNDELLAFASGVAHAAEACGASLVGGDIAELAEPGLSASLTILGTVPRGEAVTRSGAKAGDLVCVTGEIGNAFRSGHHLTFSPRLEEGRFLARARLATAMLDVSDGLLLDAMRLAASSHVRIEIDPAKVPLRAGAELPDALGDGEDYELLFTAPPHRARELAGHAAVIGRVLAGPPGVTDPAGRDLLTGKTGYEHGKH